MFGVPTESVPHLVSATQRRKDNIFGRQSRRCRQRTRNSYGTVTKRTKQDGSRSGSAKSQAKWKRAELDAKRYMLEEEEMRCQFDETALFDSPSEQFGAYDASDAYSSYTDSISQEHTHPQSYYVRHRLEQFLLQGRLTDILDLFEEHKINLGNHFLWQGTMYSSFMNFSSRMPACVGQTTPEVMEYLLENQMDHLLGQHEYEWRKMLLNSSNNGLWEFVLHHSEFMCRFGHVAMECAAHLGNLDLVKCIHEMHPSWYKSLNGSQFVSVFFSSKTLEISRYLVSTFDLMEEEVSPKSESTGYSCAYYEFYQPYRRQLQNFKPKFIRALFENHHVLEEKVAILVWSEFRWYLTERLRRNQVSVVLRDVFWPYGLKNSRPIDLGKCWAELCLCVLELEFGSRDGYDHGNIESLVIEFVGMGLIDVLLPVGDGKSWGRFVGSRLLIGWREKNARDVVLQLLRMR